jgi:hypothetical protein
MLPVVVGIELVDHYGAIGAAVPLEVTLSVTFDIQVTYLSWAGDGDFPDGGADGLSAPGNVSGEADVQGD